MKVDKQLVTGIVHRLWSRHLCDHNLGRATKPPSTTCVIRPSQNKPSGRWEVGVAHDPANMLFHGGILAVFCFSFLGSLITDILFAKRWEESGCNFDIFSLWRPWTLAGQRLMVMVCQQLRNSGRKRSREMFWWSRVGSRAEHFSWRW